MEEGKNILDQLKESSRELYKVPEGYFERFPEQMLRLVAGEDTNHGAEKAKVWSVETSTTAPSAKVVRGFFPKRFLRYAAAAAVIVAIAAGSWIWISKRNGGDVAQNSILQNVSDSEIVNYIESVPNLSTEVKEDDVKQLLADVPDAELQHYVEQSNGTREAIN